MPINKLPTWLDPNAEVTQHSKPSWFTAYQRPMFDAIFYLWCVDTFYHCATEQGYTLSYNQLIEIAANAAVETGHGQKWSGNNWGGVKINRTYVSDYKEKHGTSPKWYKDAGHIASGDQSVVYYVYFESPQDYATYWLQKFVPIDYSKEEQTEETKRTRYYKTAKAFWTNSTFTDKSQHWFYELCVSGYKGEVTKKDPGPSVDTLFNCKSRVKTMLSQLLLGLSPDNAWGNKSKEKCKEFQTAHGLSPSGILTDETFIFILNDYFTLAEFSKFLNLKF